MTMSKSDEKNAQTPTTNENREDVELLCSRISLDRTDKKSEVYRTEDSDVSYVVLNGKK